MFLAEPAPTRFDLHFSIASIPVRIHPLFWLITVLLGAGGRPPPAEVVLWVLVVFVSILVHELGHSLAHRFYGWDSHIVLYSCGGLAVRDTPLGRAWSRRRRDGISQIVISLAGPAAGFVLAMGVIAAVALAGHKVAFHFSFDPVTWDHFEWGQIDKLVGFLLFVNIFWGIVNLFPIYPLDGGQACRELLMMANARDGERQSIILSIICGVGLAVLFGVRFQSIFGAIFFGYLAYQNYVALQAYGGGFGGGYGGGRGW
jgi:stage IV sporulation protein FB